MVRVMIILMKINADVVDDDDDGNDEGVDRIMRMLMVVMLTTSAELDLLHIRSGVVPVPSNKLV